ncbi:chromo domain protein [Cucumis melo var. makuwa]|uniref:Chromo domain protein n=1 Tax=Cucumis melo var. makuwa TaxID=1194695 RepID=A0A5A7U630_CUCMM|nr:chromo domain protein [Cucumis melo var. makuwa]
MDPTDAKRWPNLMEKCFMVMDCLEEIKVKLAIFLLEVGAEDWSTLYAVQGEMTVADYKKFIELAKYALAFIVDEEDKYYSKLVESGVRVKKSLVKGDDEKISELKEPSLKTSRKEEKEKGGEASKQNQSYFSQGSYRTDDRSNKN